MSGLYSQKRWDAAPHSIVPPAEGILTAPTRCVEINAKWASIVAGVIERLADYDIWDGDENTKETAIEKIEEILSQLGTECSNGGSMSEYVLRQELELAVDTTSYTFSNVHTLAGRDMRIEVLGAVSTGPTRHLYVQVNGLTTNIYDYHLQYHYTATTYANSLQGEFQIPNALPGTATPQLIYGYSSIDFPMWKLTDRYPMMRAMWHGNQYNGMGHCRVQSQTDIQSVTLFASAGDLRAGTRLALYTRGP